ncbi:hypothetical protein DEJ48_10545 [Streptomyces venezuelae]|uniref:Uncharacterized protein n=1 Tax=Streptomyces venezuelae TaxID=54571 RepID=A0A5P2BU84_STRVZ|nr:hypothetical protein DEJ48_10545 [Streptomyces venezuelae]
MGGVRTFLTVGVRGGGGVCPTRSTGRGPCAALYVSRGVGPPGAFFGRGPVGGFAQFPAPLGRGAFVLGRGPVGVFAQFPAPLIRRPPAFAVAPHRGGCVLLPAGGGLARRSSRP